MNKKSYFLIYQAGIANVFVDTKAEYSVKRVLQSDFSSCENFCRGLKAAGECVVVGWCNEAGDILKSSWNYKNFENAPFNKQFAVDFVN